MKTNALLKLILPKIKQGLIDLGFAGTLVVADNQMTQQGITNAPTVFFSVIMESLYGQQKRKTNYDLINSQMELVETQLQETTLQFQALMPVDLSDTADTALDLINAVVYIMQSLDFLKTLADNNVGVLRVSRVRHPYFVNDEGRHQAIPSFDISFITENTIKKIVPMTNKVEEIILKI